MAAWYVNTIHLARWVLSVGSIHIKLLLFPHSYALSFAPVLHIISFLFPFKTEKQYVSHSFIFPLIAFFFELTPSIHFIFSYSSLSAQLYFTVIVIFITFPIFLPHSSNEVNHNSRFPSANSLLQQCLSLHANLTSNMNTYVLRNLSTEIRNVSLTLSECHSFPTQG